MAIKFFPRAIRVLAIPRRRSQPDFEILTKLMYPKVFLIRRQIKARNIRHSTKSANSTGLGRSEADTRSDTKQQREKLRSKNFKERGCKDIRGSRG